MEAVRLWRRSPSLEYARIGRRRIDAFAEGVRSGPLTADELANLLGHAAAAARRAFPALYDDEEQAT